MRFGDEKPTMVEVIWEFRRENCRAAAASGTPYSVAGRRPSAAPDPASPRWSGCSSSSGPVGAADEHSAAVRGCVHKGHPTLRGGLDQRRGGLVDQGVAVVADRRVEHVEPDVIEAHRDRPTRDADQVDEPFVAEFDQRVDGSARAGRLGEGHPFRVVQVDQLQTVQAQPVEALLDRGPNPGAGEVGRPRSRVDLRRQHESLG